MAKITRVFQKQFGINGPTGDFGQFGSLFNSAPVFTKDPATIQSLSNFLTGFGAEVIGGFKPALEDVNSLFLLVFYQIAYLLQQGISEWEVGTTYYIGSMVQVSGTIYQSKTDNNTGNDPTTSLVNWDLGIGGMNGGVPPGCIIPYGGDPALVPAGFLYGDGREVSRTTYSRLFSVYSTLYGVGDGATTFNLPNGKERVLIGKGSSTEFLTIGQIGGEKTHLLTAAESGLRAHTHTLTSSGDNTSGPYNRNTNQGNVTNVTTNPNSELDASSVHNNLQPYLTIGGIIVKY